MNVLNLLATVTQTRTASTVMDHFCVFVILGIPEMEVFAKVRHLALCSHISIPALPLHYQ